MSNSYLVELERLRESLRDKLVLLIPYLTENADLQTLISKVNSIGYVDEENVINNYNVIQALASNLVFELNDSEGLITSLTTTKFQATGVTKVFLPACTSTTARYCLGDNRSLTEVNMPACTELANNTFINDTALLVVKLPSIQTFNGAVFQGCTSLQSIELPNKNVTLSGSLFSGCTSLQTMIIRYTDGVITLPNTNVFTSTPFLTGTGGGGTLYVPDARVSDYQSAANWTTLYNGGQGTMNILGLSQLSS